MSISLKDSPVSKVLQIDKSKELSQVLPKTQKNKNKVIFSSN
jgi:hypothetical protein